MCSSKALLFKWFLYLSVSVNNKTTSGLFISLLMNDQVSPVLTSMINLQKFLQTFVKRVIQRKYCVIRAQCYCQKGLICLIIGPMKAAGVPGLVHELELSLCLYQGEPLHTLESGMRGLWPSLLLGALHRELCMSGSAACSHCTHAGREILRCWD